MRNRSELMPSERKGAELAATGITNRELATALLIIPKTAESNLNRFYRKLNIHSRAALGRIEGDPFGGPVAMRLGVGGSWSTVERTRLG
jgi:DNA-binding NarL/FixJ family response regulator